MSGRAGPLRGRPGGPGGGWATGSELFIGDIRPGGVDALPGWLAMHDLNELKSRVVSMIVLVLAVTFVEEAVDSPGGLHILELGGGVTVVILGLTAFLRWGNHTGEG